MICTCGYYMHAVASDNKLNRVCSNCGHTEEDKGGVIVESYIKERASESYKILYNEFTRQDPTLPYLKDLKCPNSTCDSNKGAAERKVYLIKYDDKNLKFVYICNACSHTWTSR